MNFNFCLFHFLCSCGNWLINFETMKKFLNYAVNPEKDIQSFNYSFLCKKCNRIICLKIVTRRVKEEIFVENGGVIFTGKNKK